MRELGIYMLAVVLVSATGFYVSLICRDYHSQRQRADRWEAYGRSLEKAYYGRDRTGSLPRPIPNAPKRLEAGQ